MQLDQIKHTIKEIKEKDIKRYKKIYEMIKDSTIQLFTRDEENERNKTYKKLLTN